MGCRDWRFCAIATNFFAFDPAHRKIAETNANGEITQYGYSPASDVLTLTDGKKQVTRWAYDLFGMVSNKVDAGNSRILVYHYDGVNRLTNRWSATRGNTYYTNELVGNLTRVTDTLSPSISLAYDGLNRLTNMVDASGATVYQHDVNGS